VWQHEEVSPQERRPHEDWLALASSQASSIER
jgi:hypothetical protein